MRKFLFFLLLLPAMAALGHDIYMYQQEPEKGFRLSDLGALWDKYHKESHDQWKTKVQELGKDVNEMIPEKPFAKISVPDELIPEALAPKKTKTPQEPEPVTDETPAPPMENPDLTVEEVKQPEDDVDTIKSVNTFTEGFTQNIERGKEPVVTTIKPEAVKKEDKVEKETQAAITWIGFLLEQKAVLVLGAIPLIAFLLNAFFSALFKEKEEMDKVRSLRKKKRKGGGFQYSRK